MSFLHGVLHLFSRTRRGACGCRSTTSSARLADDQQERSIGVILSGMGSDGTLGLRAIKEKAGLMLVQDPASAKFDGMPRSAIEAGLADIVAPADALPGRLQDYLHSARRPVPAEAPDESVTRAAWTRW